VNEIETRIQQEETREQVLINTRKAVTGQPKKTERERKRGDRVRKSGGMSDISKTSSGRTELRGCIPGREQTSQPLRKRLERKGGGG